MKNIILLSLITANFIYANNNIQQDKILKEKLFEKAFKKKSQIKEFYLPLRINKIIQDEVFVRIDKQEHVLINVETMKYISSLLKEKYKQEFQYNQLDKDGFAPLSTLEQFGIKAVYNNQDIMLDIFLPINIKKASLIRLNRTYTKDLNGSILPQNYSGGVNFYLNQQYYKDTENNAFKKNPLNISSDITLNSHDYILEGRIQYKKGSDKEFSRGKFRLVKDDLENHLRYTLGDIILPHQDRMSYQTTLGVGVEKIFNIGNSYHQNISRINSYEFFLQNRSRVEIYVNDRYRNSLTLLAGTHNLYDLNLPSGLNRVKLKIIEDGGKIEYLEFNDFSYSEVLQKGVIKYGIGIGLESKFQDSEWDYNKEKKLASAYIEYGLFDSITIESGIQSADDYISGALEFLLGTNFGLFNPYIIINKVDGEEGYKKGLDYRTNIGELSLNLAYQETDNSFKTTSGSDNQKSKLYRGNIYTKIGFDINIGLSASQYTKEDIEENKYGLTLSKSFGKWLTQLDFDQRKKDGEENDKQIYLTFEYRFGQNKAKYINYIKEEKKQNFNLSHNSKGRYGLSSEFQYENSDKHNRYNLRTNFNNEKFKLNTTYNLQENKEINNDTQSFSVQLATGIVFAGEKATITAPINSSFIIVDNDNKLEKPLGLISYQESDEFIYDTYAIAMSDYSQRELTVDETELDFGTDLKEAQQRFISNYKSGSIMKIAIQNLYSIKGVFYDEKTKKPLKFKAFKVFNTITGDKSNSFSNENGEFIINQAEVGIYNITFMKEKNYEGVARYSFEIEENKYENKLINLGKIYIKMPKKKKQKKYLIYNKKNKTITNTFNKLLKNIYFNTNSYAIKITDYEKLNNIAKELKNHPEITLDIIGHSDATENSQYNMELSYRRASSVQNYLEKQGVNSTQLNSLGIGSKQSISHEVSKNRRTEFKGEVHFQIH